MLKLCGFSASNYYSKVKLALLEKGIPFEESLCWLGETDLDSTPLGKVPYLQTPQGALCESAVIVEYLEDAYPSKPLLPSDPFARAKVREINTFLELHLELEARKLYPQAFFGGQVSEGVKQKVAEQLEKTWLPFPSWCVFHHSWQVANSRSQTVPPSHTCPWYPAPRNSFSGATSWQTCRCATTSSAWPKGPTCKPSMPTAKPTPSS